VSSTVYAKNFFWCLCCYWDHCKTVFFYCRLFCMKIIVLSFLFSECLLWDGECKVVNGNAITNFSTFHFCSYSYVSSFLE
jgi:hypothetical protein